jgi:hypothetical protein
MPHLITLVCRQISVDNNRDEMYAGAVNASGISQLECVGLLQKHCIRNLHTKNIGMLFVSSRHRCANFNLFYHRGHEFNQI